MLSFSKASLASFCSLNEGWGYVWGASGQVYNTTTARSLYNAFGYPNNSETPSQYNETYYMTTQIKLWNNKRVVDCSGLIEAFNGINQTANTLKSNCPTSGSFTSTDSLEKGCLLFRDGHVGVYIGNGQVIHSKGSEYGVVKENVSSVSPKFTTYGIPLWLHNGIPTKDVDKFSSVFDIQWLQSALGVVVTGKYDSATAEAYKKFATLNGIPYTLNGYVTSLQGIKYLAGI